MARSLSLGCRYGYGYFTGTGYGYGYGKKKCCKDCRDCQGCGCPTSDTGLAVGSTTAKCEAATIRYAYAPNRSLGAFSACPSPSTYTVYYNWTETSTYSANIDIAMPLRKLANGSCWLDCDGTSITLATHTIIRTIQWEVRDGFTVIESGTRTISFEVTPEIYCKTQSTSITNMIRWNVSAFTASGSAPTSCSHNQYIDPATIAAAMDTDDYRLIDYSTTENAISTTRADDGCCCWDNGKNACRLPPSLVVAGSGAGTVDIELFAPPLTQHNDFPSIDGTYNLSGAEIDNALHLGAISGSNPGCTYEWLDSLSADSLTAITVQFYIDGSNNFVVTVTVTYGWYPFTSALARQRYFYSATLTDCPTGDLVLSQTGSQLVDTIAADVETYVFDPPDTITMTFPSLP